MEECGATVSTVKQSNKTLPNAIPMHQRHGITLQTTLNLQFKNNYNKFWYNEEICLSSTKVMGR
jgi:hypothetical protein